MHVVRRFVPACSFAALLACNAIDQASAPADPGFTSLALVQDAASEPRVSGSGHFFRDLGAGPELTTFSYSAVSHGDTASGEYQYHHRAAGFFIHGTVTCVTTADNQGWIGGLIDRVVSPDPEDQTLVGTEIWWRVIDHGSGADAPPDETTSLLFALPGLPITAASWCHDQNVRGLLRPIDHGNIEVR